MKSNSQPPSSQPDKGAFEWKRRMGQHYAYHLNKTNRYIHFAMIPFELMGPMLLLSAIPFPFHFDSQEYASIQSSLVIFLLSLVYCQTDFVCGLSATGVLVLLQAFVFQVYTLILDYGNYGDAAWIRITCGVLLFAATNLIQTKIGHKKFEPNGRDDTDLNLKEFIDSGNPIPLLLIFYYHWVEVLLLLGYGKSHLKPDIEYYRDNYQYPTVSTAHSAK